MKKPADLKLAINKLKYATKELQDIGSDISDIKERIESYKMAVDVLSEIEQEWTDSKVIDFVNWYIDVHQLGGRYKLENQTIIDSFLKGDEARVWHSCPDLTNPNP